MGKKIGIALISLLMAALFFLITKNDVLVLLHSDKDIYQEPVENVEQLKIGTSIETEIPFTYGCILGSESKFYEFISTLDETYDYYKQNGINLAYHHHNWEYITLSNGQTRMNELLSKTNKINFVFDTYWTVKSSFDPLKQINQFNDRLLGVHLRDLKLYKKGLKVLSKDCELGQGIINFKEIIDNAISVGCKYFVIEQKTNTPYKSIEKSYNYLINNKIVER